MADKKSGRKLQFAIFGLISLIALAICAAVLVITARTVESETTASVEYETQSKTPLSQDKDVLLSYIKTITQEATNNSFIKADIYNDVSVDDGTITATDASGTQLDDDITLLVYAKNKLIPTVDSYYPQDVKGVFGTVNTSIPVIDLTADKVKDVTFSVGLTDEFKNPVYNTDTGELIDGDYYFITVELIPETDSYSAEFSKKFLSDISGVCKINSGKVSLSQSTISLRINRLTDRIDTVTYDKTYQVAADVSFINELSVFPQREIRFEFKTSERYEYAYAGIRFAQSSATVEPDGEIMLSVNAVIENDSEYTVTFASSDTAAATIDEMGYVKGITASDEPITITVTLDYLGEKFTDECTVYVNEAEDK